MPKKIRVHELAKELGMTNQSTLDLCLSLGMGVKSHSSSIEEAQADRARRKARRDKQNNSRAVGDMPTGRRYPGGFPGNRPPGFRRARNSPVVSSSRAARVAKTSRKSTSSVSVDDAASHNVSAQNVNKRNVEQTSVQKSNTSAQKTTRKPQQTDRRRPHAGSPANSTTSSGVHRVVSSQLNNQLHNKSHGSAQDSVGSKSAVGAATGSSGEFVSTKAARQKGSAQKARTAPRHKGGAQKTTARKGGAQKGTAKTDRTFDRKDNKKLGPQSQSARRQVQVNQVAGMAVPVSARSGKPIPPPPPPPRVTQRRDASKNTRSRSSTSSAPHSKSRSGFRTTGAGNRSSGAPNRGTPNRGAQHKVTSIANAKRPASAHRRPSPGGFTPGAAPGRGNRSTPRPQRRRSSSRRKREVLRPMDVPTYTPSSAPVPEGVVVVERASTAQDLGSKLNRTAADVVRFLINHGEMVTVAQSLSDEMIELFALDVGAEIKLVDIGEEQEVELQKLLGIDSVDNIEQDEAADTRPPVITVMGHVDHGKTLLLDRIRDTNAVAGEFGGITQHIGAYQVERNGEKVTFLDTPGHEAFTAMRARGASATDIVILVVAADDGVMPQTIEAINHAKAAEVPILVAVNKIDRPNADIERTIASVAEHGLVPESWGGDTIYCEVSALKSIGITELLDQVLLLAEIEGLNAYSEGQAVGVVLESHLDVGRGPVATLLVQRGTLNVGDPVVAGAAWGKVRALINDCGEAIESAGPSSPVQVLGMSGVADAGDMFSVAPNEKIAARVAQTREHWQRMSNLGREAHAMSGGAKLEDIFSRIQQGETTPLNLIVKADVNGSLEAVVESLRKLENDEIRVVFLHRGVGGITENDVQLAAVSDSTVIGFNVRPDRKARELAEVKQVEIRTYEIIYKLLEDVQAAAEGMLTPDVEEHVTGEAEVREIFRVARVGAVAGCYVRNGSIKRGSQVRFLREGKIIWKGTISSLKRFAEDVREVNSGFECGIGLSNFQDLKSGDIIETFDEREIPQTANK